MKRRKKINRVEIHENITKSKTLIKCLLVVLIILTIGIGVLIFNQARNLYNNVNEAEEEKIKTAINDYALKGCDKENPAVNTKCFISNKIYLIERIIDHDDDLAKEYGDYDAFYYAYAWIVKDVYYKTEKGIEEDSGSSIPNKILLGKKGEKYTALKTQIPRDGTYYPEDMKKLFPARIRNKMNNAQVDGTVEDLIKKNKQQAEEYFK